MQHFNNTVAFNYDTKRKEELRNLRYLGDKPTTYETFLKHYLKTMRFIHDEIDVPSRLQKGKKYTKMMQRFEVLARLEWKKLPKVKEA